MAGAAAGSQRSFRNSPTGVPAGTEGCDMSAGVAWLATWLPAAAVLTKGDGRAVESSDQAGVPAAPATAGPPELTR